LLQQSFTACIPFADSNTDTQATIYGLFSRTTGVRPVPEETFFWTFMVHGKITEADTLTIRLGATPSRLISAHLHHPPIFTLDALPATTLPLYPDLGQAPNMLTCIPSGVVAHSN